MHRRPLLAAGVYSLGLMTAGCLGGGASSNGNGGDGGGQTDAEATESVTDESMVQETEFEVLAIETSSGDEGASVTFDGARVTVAGTISGSNGCYTARLGVATVEDDALVMRIESYEDADEQQDCTQATVLIEYRAVVETDEPPASVSVEHNGDVVATAQRS